MSQSAKILEYLKAGNSITAIDALRMFSCFRLASRIHDIRKTYDVIGETITLPNGKRIESYRIGVPGEQIAMAFGGRQ